jgi:hypothetical protein
MVKDSSGRPMLLPTWWQSIAAYAARLVNCRQDKIREVNWDPVVEGHIKEFRRYFEPGRYTVHEAFLAGDVIQVHAVLPDGLSVAEFAEIMKTAGRYIGMCPYKPEKHLGTFEILDVRPAGHPRVTPAVLETPLPDG